MLRRVATVPLTFQHFPRVPDNSMRHARDMERAGFTARARRTPGRFQPFGGYHDCDYISPRRLDQGNEPMRSAGENLLSRIAAVLEKA